MKTDARQTKSDLELEYFKKQLNPGELRTHGHR